MHMRVIAYARGQSPDTWMKPWSLGVFMMRGNARSDAEHTFSTPAQPHQEKMCALARTVPWSILLTVLCCMVMFSMVIVPFSVFAQPFQKPEPIPPAPIPGPSPKPLPPAPKPIPPAPPR